MSGKKTSKTLVSILVITMMFLAAACSSNNDQATPAPGSGTTAAEQSDNPSQTPVVMEDGPLGKYSPEITVTTVRQVNASGGKGLPGMSYDKNMWTDSFKKDLGINLVNEWKVATQQYTDKITVSMVAQNLPDFYEVNAQQFATLVKAGQIADLTDLYDKYASDMLKGFLEYGEGTGLKSSTVDGKLMAIPLNGGTVGNFDFLWIRNDWLKNLGLEPPKTMADVEKIAIAFAKDDPDGNHQDDTIGLGLSNELMSGYHSLVGFFNGYHAYPYNPAKGDGATLTILKDDQGNPVWADTLPEVKTALARLQSLYQAGAIDPEFNSTDGGKAGDLTTQGKMGMFFGRWQMATWPLNNMKKNDPNVDWQAYMVPSSDDQPVKMLSPGGATTRFIVINKNAKNPEAVFKLANYFVDKLNGPNQDESYHQVIVEGETHQVFTYAPVQIFAPNTNNIDNASIQEALKTGDPSKLTQSAKVYWDGIQAYNEGKGDLGQWVWYGVFGPKGAFNLVQEVQDSKNYVQTHYFGNPTPTMMSKGGALRDLEVQTMTKIIMGVEPVEAWDDFVAKWRKQGGDQILQEVKDSGLFK